MSFKSTLPDTLATRLASIPKPVYLTAIPASIATLLLLRAALGSGPNRTPDPAQQKVVPSPLHSLTVDEADELPYAPDSLPGARDVDSPWGSIRVYEWGPVQGKKVLLVHGISTPSVAMSKVAEGLVDKGCRVMLFGMFFFSFLFAPLFPPLGSSRGLLLPCATTRPSLSERDPFPAIFPAHAAVPRASVRPSGALLRMRYHVVLAGDLVG